MTMPVPPNLLRGAPAQQPAQQQQQPVDEFELMRRRLQQRGAVAGKERQRELSRQFAALGSLPSGAAFRIRQQAAEAGQRATSEAVQDVNILQAQTQRAERESAAQRGLQRELGQLGAATQLQAAQIGQETTLGAARIGAESAQAIERMRGQFGAEAQQREIAAAQQNLQAQLQSQENLANLDARTRTYLGDLDFQSRMRELDVSDATARYLGEMELDNQLTIASMDNALKSRGLDIQTALAQSNIQAQDFENKLNTYATWVNAIAPLKQAGFDDRFINDLKGQMGIDFQIDGLNEFEDRQFVSAEQRARPGAANVQFGAPPPSQAVPTFGSGFAG